MTRIAAVLALLALAPAGAAAQGAGTSRPGGEAATAPPAKPGAGAAPAVLKAGAPGEATAAQPSRVAMDLARALTTQATWDGILDAYATSLAGQISAALGASGQKPAPDLLEKIRADLHETVEYDEAIELQARSLASRFDPEELAALERFYRSGPGKKLLDVLPDVSREVNDDLRERLSERVPQIVRENAPSLAAGEGAAERGTASGGAETSREAAPEKPKEGKAQGRTPAKPPGR